jgi:hypothetical protein
MNDKTSEAGLLECVHDNFAGSEIGRVLARPTGVRAKDGAHQNSALPYMEIFHEHTG